MTEAQKDSIYGTNPDRINEDIAMAVADLRKAASVERAQYRATADLFSEAAEELESALRENRIEFLPHGMTSLDQLNTDPHTKVVTIDDAFRKYPRVFRQQGMIHEAFHLTREGLARANKFERGSTGLECFAEAVLNQVIRDVYGADSYLYLDGYTKMCRIPAQNTHTRRVE
jgi:hypothetical protein